MEFKECKRDMQRRRVSSDTIDFILFIKTYGSYGLRLQKQGNKEIQLYRHPSLKPREAWNPSPLLAYSFENGAV